MWRHGEKRGICKARREPSGETSPVPNWSQISKFHNCEECLLFEPPSLWHSVMAARVNKYTLHQSSEPTETGMGKWGFENVAFDQQSIGLSLNLSPQTTSLWEACHMKEMRKHSRDGQTDAKERGPKPGRKRAPAQEGMAGWGQVASVPPVLFC